MDEISIHTRSSVITKKYVVAQEITDDSNMLTRSISSSALTQIRARSGSIVSQTSRVTASSASSIHRHTLHRTLSSKSLTLPSPIIQTASLNKSSQLYDDTLDQFIGFVEGRGDTMDEQNEYYEQMNNLWESLPQSTKDIFISRALQKRGNDVDYEDVKALFPGESHPPSKSGYMQYRKRIGPYLRQVNKKLDEVTISKITSEMYWGELNPNDRKQLQKEASAHHTKFMTARVQAAKKYANNINSNNTTNELLKRDPILSQIPIEPRVNRVLSILKKMNTQSKKIINKLSSNKNKKKNKDSHNPSFEIAI